jgi:hypothetical protein
MRYWVYLGEKPEAGPFPDYDEAFREREHLLRGLIIGGLPSIYKIRTDGYANAPQLAETAPCPPPVERIPDLTREQFLALTDEERQARLDHQKAYSDQFPRGEYPCRDQNNSEYQRFADAERAAGWNPPGIYC